MADESKSGDAPKRRRGRRGRRGTVCAVPVKLEAGWKPRIVNKSEEAKERIRAVVAKCILFSGMDAREREVIVDAMEEKKFAADDIIIRQGDVGDFFYVLDTGHCDIHVEGVGKVMDVGPGGSFGELALMYDAPRAATVTATEPCTTWALDQVTFKKTIMDATMKKRQRHENFIKSVPILSTLNQYERLTIADALSSESFKENEVVINEGDEGDKFYIVESGEFKVTKEGVDGEVHDRLTSGDYFGERALLTNEARAATITAVSAGICQVLDRATFKRLLGPLGDIMRKNMEVYNKYKDSVTAAEAADDEGKKNSESDDDDDDA